MVQSALTATRPPSAAEGDDGAEERDAVRPGEGGIGVGKVGPEVAEPRRAEYGVGRGRGPRSRRRCAPRAPAPVNAHAAEDKGRAGSGEKGWTSNPWPMRTSGAEQVGGVGEVGRGRDLDVVMIPLHDHDRSPEVLDQPGIVGGIPAPACACSRTHAEGLGGLDRHEPVARHRGAAHPGVVDLLQGVGDGDRADGTGHVGVSRGLEHGTEQPWSGEGPGGVVDHHDRGPGGHGREAATHRRRATCATGDDAVRTELWDVGTLGTTTTTPSQTLRQAVTDQAATAVTEGEELLSLPKRLPEPPATTTPQTGPPSPLRKGVVQTLLGGLLVDAEGEGELGDEDWRALESMRFSPADSPLSLSGSRGSGRLRRPGRCRRSGAFSEWFL